MRSLYNYPCEDAHHSCSEGAPGKFAESYLTLTSVWRAKCKEFQKEPMKLGVNGYDAPDEFAEMSARVDLCMESKM